MIYLGIDPGLLGAIAILGPDGAQTVHKMPTLKAGAKVGRLSYDERMIGELLSLDQDDGGFVVIEQPALSPVKGKGGVFRPMLAGAAYSLGLCTGLCLSALPPAFRWELVRANAWKKAMMGGLKGKDASIAVAKRLFPGVRLCATDRCTKPDHNMAEALLLAEYARRRGSAAGVV